MNASDAHKLVKFGHRSIDKDDHKNKFKDSLVGKSRGNLKKEIDIQYII